MILYSAKISIQNMSKLCSPLNTNLTQTWVHAAPPLDKHHSLHELHLQALISSEIFLCSMVVHMTEVSPIPERSSRCAGRQMITVRYTRATELITETARHKHRVPHTARSRVLMAALSFDFPILKFSQSSCRLEVFGE